MLLFPYVDIMCLISVKGKWHLCSNASRLGQIRLNWMHLVSIKFAATPCVPRFDDFHLENFIPNIDITSYFGYVACLGGTSVLQYRAESHKYDPLHHYQGHRVYSLIYGTHYFLFGNYLLLSCSNGGYFNFVNR